MTDDARAAELAVTGALLRRSYETWAERYYRIRNKSKQVELLRLRPCQYRVGRIEHEQLAMRGRARLYVLKGRQGGITTDQQARSLHTIWAQKHAQCITIADTWKRTQEIFGITKRALRYFPPDILPMTGDAYANEVSFVEQDSKLKVETAGEPEKTAIGLTLTRCHASEFAHWPSPAAALAALTPALEAPGTVIVLETTASGFDSEGHNVWRNAEEAGYVQVFIPWWECDPETYQMPLLEPDELGQLEDDEKALHEMQGLTLEQLKWRRAKMAEYGRNEFLRQYAEDDESCWLAVGGMYYDVADIRILLQRVLEPLDSHMGGEHVIYDAPKPGERVVIGCDTAEGGGGDDSTMVARGMDGWRLLETFASDTITPGDFATFLAHRGRKLNEALIVCEKNMHGITVLRDLRDREDYPVSSIYHREPLDSATASSSERIGWATTEESKPLMLAAGRELIVAARHGLAGVPPAQALKDALSVRRDESGRYKLNGRDMLVAEMLAWIGRSAPIPSEGLFEAMKVRAMAAKR